MAVFQLNIVDKAGCVLAESYGEREVTLVYKGEYAEGDRILLTVSDLPLHVVWQVDETLGPALCYLTENVSYQIPFGEKRAVYSPNSFKGSAHYLYVREADEEECKGYRNLALNVADQHDVRGCYPHASANVETRGEAVFAARNAIDGVWANRGHGLWPYESWGINRDPRAELKLEFGRPVVVDCIKICLRADFPHDSYWTKGTIRFSDGTQEVLSFVKTDRRQSFSISSRTIEWLTFGDLIKAEDESPFPALTQIEVYGNIV